MDKSETGLYDVSRSEGCSHGLHLMGKTRSEEWVSDEVGEVADPVSEIKLALVILRYGITNSELEEVRQNGKSISRDPI